MALASHNDKRQKHCAPDYTLDIEMAKEMQILLESNQRPTQSSERSQVYANCQENFYTAPEAISEESV